MQISNVASDARSSDSELHIVLGDSAAATFRIAFPSSAQSVLIDQDVLSCGPTPRCDDLGHWRAIRHRFWAELVPDLIDEHVPSPSNVLDHLNRLQCADRVLIWTASGVSEQVFLAFMCHLFRLTNTAPARVSIVQFELHPRTGTIVRGLGELEAEDLRAHPTPIPMTEAALRDYLDAWDALTSPDPTSLARFASDHPNASEWLKQAMRVLLRRFPDKSSGLPHWDAKLLECVHRHGSKAARVIGYAMADGWPDGDLVGDWYLFGRLLRLSDLHRPRPLVAITGDRKNMRHTEVSLTSFGRAVLDGRESDLAVNSIDEWAGGVHLSSNDGNVWVREGAGLTKL